MEATRIRRGMALGSLVRLEGFVRLRILPRHLLSPRDLSMTLGLTTSGQPAIVFRRPQHCIICVKNQMGDSGATDLGQNVSWTIVLEEYFAQTGEKANGLAIMHKKAESIFTRRKTYIDLPVIIGSGAVAFLNAGSSSLFAGNQQLAATALGVGSLVIGILNTPGLSFDWRSPD